MGVCKGPRSMTGMSATCGVCRTVIVRWFEDKSPEREQHDSYLIAISRGLGKVPTFLLLSELNLTDLWDGKSCKIIDSRASCMEWGSV